MMTFQNTGRERQADLTHPQEFVLNITHVLLSTGPTLVVFLSDACSACRSEYFPVVSDLWSAVSVTPAEAEPSQQQPGRHQGDPPAPD